MLKADVSSENEYYNMKAMMKVTAEESGMILQVPVWNAVEGTRAAQRDRPILGNLW